MNVSNNTGTICHWNVRGFRANYLHLRTLLSDTQACVMCLQETMMPHPTPNAPRGFNMFEKRGPHNGGPVNHGGVCTLVKNTIANIQLNLNTELQAVAVRCQLDQLYTICNIYLPPSENVSLQQLEDLVAQLPTPYLLVGDFNARHPLWGDTLCNQKGRIVESLIDSTPCSILNNGRPTHLHQQTNSTTCIDLTIVSSESLPNFTWTTLDDLYNSDHYPILVDTREAAYKSCPIKFIFEKANWSKFKEEAICYQNVESFLNIDDALTYFNSTIINSATIAIPQTKGVPRTKTVPWWNKELQQAVKIKKDALRKYFRTRLVEDRTSFKRARAHVRFLIRKSQRESWKTYVSSINEKTPINKVWEKVNKISGKYSNRHTPVLRNNQEIVSDPAAVADIFGESLSNISRGSQNSEFLKIKRKAESVPIQYPPDDGSDYNNVFTITEMENALKHSSDSAAGEDRIYYSMIKNLPDISKNFLLLLYNRIWTENTFPTLWKTAIIHPFMKRGKEPLDKLNYRPIALTSAACKIVERMVNVRLVWVLEKNEILHPNQYGFRKCRSSLDALARFDSFVKMAFARREHVIAVFFDIEKAYDTTWRNHILTTLRNIPLMGHLPRFIENFLTDRIMRVKIGNALSNPYCQYEGVPQGSVLSCSLFALAINNLAKSTPQYVENVLYVDDFTIFTRSASLPSAERRIQLATNKAYSWAQKHGFRFSLSKTVCMHFTKIRGLFPPLQIKIDNNTIPHVQKTKLLGMTLDPKLSWILHLKDLKARCTRALDILKCLSRKTWGADRTTLLRIYRAQIRSKLDYGCTIYGSATKTSLKMLDSIHHQGIRLSTGAFRTSPIESLYIESGEPSLSFRRDKLTLQMYTRLLGVQNSPAYDAICLSVGDQIYERNERLHSDLGFRARKLLRILEIPEPTIAQSLSYQICPFTLKLEPMCSGMTGIRKADTSKLTVKNLFSIHLENHQGDTEIYTDGSKTSNYVSCASVHPNKIISRKLPIAASIYTAELQAILTTLAFLIRSPETSFVIYCDSISAIQSIQDPFSNHPIVKQIQLWLRMLQSQNKFITFCWVPSHCGITGNETADQAAKLEGEREGGTVDIALPCKDLYPVYHSKLLERWADRWANINNNKLRAIRQGIREWATSNQSDRKTGVILTRLRIGHSRLTHGFLLAGEEPPFCMECILPLTIRHILIECPEYMEERRMCFGGGRLLTLRWVLRDEESAVEDLMRFLTRTNLINDI